jgi:creatinine amidohydrolase/Fe(II)-dependent formamide hydrolase-like protein
VTASKLSSGGGIVAAVVEYVDLSLSGISALRRDKAVFFISVSPIEVHGPHLPVGIDVMISEEVRRRTQGELARTRPDLLLVNLPPLYCGSDALPVSGSISVRAPALESVLCDYARALAKQGFKYLVVLDNHGGPRHHLAILAAARNAWRKLGFRVIHPFADIYKLMIRDDPELLAMTGLRPGECGDDADNHAGTNETSMLLAMSPDKSLDQRWRTMPASVPPRLRGLPRLLDRAGALLWRIGAVETGPDLRHLAQTLAWVGEKPFVPYMGAPTRASAEAGEAMLKAHVRITLALLGKALAGERVLPRPILGALSFLRRLPE